MINFLLVFIFVAIIFLRFTIFHKDTIRFTKVRKNQHTRDLENGFEEYPKFVRDLTKNEIDTLHNLNKSFLQYYWNNLLKGLSSTYIDLGLIFLVSIVTNTFPYVLIIVEVVFSVSIAIITFLQRHKIYLDLRSPIYGAEGQLFIYWQGDVKNTGTYFQIRDIKIYYSIYPNFAEYLSILPERSNVYIEYSPHTKHVWSVKKSEL